MPPPRRLWPLPAAGIALSALPNLNHCRCRAAPRRAVPCLPPRLSRPPARSPSLSPALQQRLRRNAKPTQPLGSAPPLVCHAWRLLREAPRSLPQPDAASRRQRGAQGAGNAPQPGRAEASPPPAPPVSDAPGSQAAAAAPGQLFLPLYFIFFSCLWRRAPSTFRRDFEGVCLPGKAARRALFGVGRSLEESGGSLASRR